MKQILQSYKTGKVEMADVPMPFCHENGVLVETRASLVSAGTERMIMDIAQKSLLGKAKARPDLVEKVLNKVKEEGIFTTAKKVFTKLDSPVSLGYSCAGKVIGVGKNVTEIKMGDRVACAGTGYANHAEINFVPQNLCIAIPEGINYEDASFTTLGAIAMQGIRRCGLTPGEKVGVIGLGLIGQLTVQILSAYGFPVFGVDINEGKVERTLPMGLEKGAVIGRDRIEDIVDAMSLGQGLDAVIITAFTQTNDPLELAGKISRQGGRVSMVGVTGMDVPRDLYYKKELDLRMSRSYGPGRYDVSYEEKGRDYPYPYVRWTEKRNMEEFLRLLANGKINVAPIITHHFDLEDYEKVYRLITENPKNESYGGIILNYQGQCEPLARVEMSAGETSCRPLKKVVAGVIGCGSFAQGTILPALQKINMVSIKDVVSGTGKTAQYLAKKYHYHYCSTDYTEILRDQDINTVFVMTRHHLHARIVCEALKAGKHVFVEKPLCLDRKELKEIIEVYQSLGKDKPLLMVGFNRRFSSVLIEARKRFASRSTPLMVSYRVNAGYIPADHWVHDAKEGGGRIIGEICHFVDALQYLTNSVPVKIYAVRLPSGGKVFSDDNVNILIDFSDGSQGSVLYTALGDKQLGKEYVEIFGDGKSFVINDFKRGILGGQDKGHARECQDFVSAVVKGLPSPIPFEEIISATAATLNIGQSLRTGNPVKIDLAELL